MEPDNDLIQKIFQSRLKYSKESLSSTCWSEISKELEVDNPKEVYHDAIRDFKQTKKHQSIFNNHLNIINFDYCLENFQQICRLCLQIKNIKEIDLKNNQYDMLDFLNSIHNTSSDSDDTKLFNQICSDCHAMIQKVYEFKKECKENYKVLMEVKDVIKEPPVLESHRSKPKKSGTICQICGKQVKGIQTHMLIHKGIKKFNCEFCTKSFTQSGQLKRHINSHLNIRNYSCPHQGCDKTFVDPSSVSKHIVIHNKEKRPFICSICCASFNRQGALRYHEKTHRQERNHKCDVCHKTFLAKYDLTKHSRTHSGEKPYGCGYCEKRFSISKNAKVHQRVHTKEKPFECRHCDMKFSYKSSMKQHETKFHDNVENVKNTELLNFH